MSYGGGVGAGCLTGARFTMNATLLHQNDPNNVDPIIIDDYGTWVQQQDPLTGEIVRVWVPNDPTPIDPNDPNPNVLIGDVPCLARGIVDGGIRVAGTTERFGDMYENIDFVKMWVPSYITVTKRDRITNIRDKNGHIRWLDEESIADPSKATVFNVNGVTPLFNAFNELTEWFVLLERAEVSANAV